MNRILCLYRLCKSIARVISSPFLSITIGGASAPVTLLGELVVINTDILTDILAWIVVLQILFPGASLLYGSVAAVLDMRTGLLPLGAPERGTIDARAALMARHYGLLSLCGGLSDAEETSSRLGCGV